MVKQIRFTKQGYEKLKKDYDDLLKSRPVAVEHLKKSRELGDLSENGYYKASRAKLSSIDYQLMRLKMTLKQAVIIEAMKDKIVTIGSVVTLTAGDKEFIYSIAGDLEANPSEGKISLLSPLGKAIERKQIGDIVEFKTPSGVIKYTIKNIS